MRLKVERWWLTVALVLAAEMLWAGQAQKGDEVAGEAFVSWKAVVEKVTTGPQSATRVKARLEFEGRTLGGNRIRGTGKMRFVGVRNTTYNPGELLQGSGAIKYWASVTGLLGDDLVMMKGVAVLDFSRPDSVLPIQAVVELKAALDNDT